MPRPSVPRYHKQRAAIVLARRYCIRNWPTLIGIQSGAGSRWSRKLKLWFLGTSESMEVEHAADHALRKINDAITALKQFKVAQEKLDAQRTRARPLFASEILRRWLQRHGRAVLDFDKFAIAPLALTPRQILVQRSRWRYPNVFDPLRPVLQRVHWTDTRLAAVSLLCGNEPQVSKQQLRTGITAAQVLQLEARHIRKARADLAKKLAEYETRRATLRGS